MSLPDLLSLSRIFLIPPIIILFEFNYFLSATLVYILASVSDFLDGYIARLYKLESLNGEILDLMADKIFISTLLIWSVYNFQDLIILIAAILIILRELSMSFLRMHLQIKDMNSVPLKADLFGKLKTTTQMTGMGFLIVSPVFGESLFLFASYLILFSGIISWLSLLNYLKKI